MMMMVVQLRYIGASCCLWLGLWVSLSPAGLALPEVVFRCPPCTAERIVACSLPPASDGPAAAAPCPEVVREPGCGCCPVCARLEGEPCGVYTPRCASGFRCYPRPGAELPLQALVQGQGTCVRRGGDAAAADGEDPSGGTDNFEPPEGTIAGNSVDSTMNGPRKPWNSRKELAIFNEKVKEQHKQMGNAMHPHLPELWPPPLRTPCQQELDQVLERISAMHLPDERGPLEHLYSLNIPNCDKQGLYNLKQCKMSVNGQRGECWCVNPQTGTQIQESPTIRGDPECHRFYSGHEPEDRGAHALHVQ